MKKKRLAAVLALIICMCFVTGCGGDTRSAVRNIGESDVYTKMEIQSAMDKAESHFRRHFKGCTLTYIEYDEEYSQKRSDDWAENYEADEAIVLTSGFTVSKTGASPSLEPGGTYKNWNWVLTRNNGGMWKLQTWGYG